MRRTRPGSLLSSSLESKPCLIFVGDMFDDLVGVRFGRDIYCMDDERELLCVTDVRDSKTLDHNLFKINIISELKISKIK